MIARQMAQNQLYGNYNMSISRNRVCVIAALALISLLAAAPCAHAIVLDWDNVVWTPNGNLTNSYDVTGDTKTDVTFTMTSQQPNIWTNDAVSGTLTPTINQTMTGGRPQVLNGQGVLVDQSSLLIAANLKTQSDATIHLNFTGGQWGANNVSFTIFDIDITTNADIISNIYGVALDGSHVAATLSNIGSTVTATGSGLTYNLEGNAAAANNTSNGNVTLSFGSTIITDVFFTFSNTAGAPRYQDIALGDVTFTPVPEINPTIAAAGSCLLALGTTRVLHRRARRRAVQRDVV
jgi:hypothetical protein